VHIARLAELDSATLYALMRLRQDVFIVEQTCPYGDLDGRDTEPATRHLWIGDPPVAYLRVLRDPDTWRIGRVCTARTARGQGMSGRLMRAALDLEPGPWTLDAQSYLVRFYESFGFTATGPEYLEDGIPHTPMARPATP
jgi:ElaA protein